jgi:ribosomal protein S19
MRVLRVFSRSSTILDQFVGLRFEVYNGKTFKTLKISKEMVGYKFGEFVFTKKLGSSIHKKKITKRQQKKSKNK